MLAQEEKVLQPAVETIYRVNSDDYVRAELEAREEALRVQRTMETIINEQQDTITQYENKEIQRITKKILAGKSLEQIATELEEATEAVSELYSQIKANLNATE